MRCLKDLSYGDCIGNGGKNCVNHINLSKRSDDMNRLLLVGILTILLLSLFFVGCTTTDDKPLASFSLKNSGDTYVFKNYMFEAVGRPGSNQIGKLRVHIYRDNRLIIERYLTAKTGMDTQVFDSYKLIYSSYNDSIAFFEIYNK